jgi:drug/metabolite transporter (DMT)-like permease
MNTMKDWMLNLLLRREWRHVRSRRYVGFLMVLIGAGLWGLSGTAAQELFQHDGFTPGWLVTMRMSISGVILLFIVGMRIGFASLFQVWKNPQNRTQIIIFSILGLIGVQYTYFTSIHLGNAATATFLQYLGPLFIMIYMSLRQRRLPSLPEGFAVLFALTGTFLLVTNGSLHSVVVSDGAIVWGIISAIALAFYTLYPGPLLRRIGSATTIGWAMLIGGLICATLTPPWQTRGQHWNLTSVYLIGFVVIFGTLIAFYLYLASTHFITPTETSVTACFEPLSAATAAVVWLHVTLGPATVIGGLLILVTVIILTVKGDPPDFSADLPESENISI